MANSVAIESFQQCQSVSRFVNYLLASPVGKQKAFADQRGRKNFEKFSVGDKVLLSAVGIQEASVTNLGTSKLAPRYIVPFNILAVKGNAYTFSDASAPDVLCRAP